MTEQVSLFTEEQLLGDGLFGQFDSIPPRYLISNHLANLQLTYGLTSQQAVVLFLISVTLVGIERGLLTFIDQMLCQHCGLLLPYDAAGHDGEYQCDCGGDFCGCPYCCPVAVLVTPPLSPMGGTTIHNKTSIQC